MKRRMALVVLTSAVSLASAFSDSPAQEFSSHDPGSTAVVDHSAWAAILEEFHIDDHPSGVARVDYEALNRTGRKDLADYISSLESIDPAVLNRNEQRAYWINLYNAVTVALIVDNLPLESIRDIRRPWKQPLATVNGRSLSLDEIEHGILRVLWNDPRIHYAVNCASVGCPDLAPRPYTGAMLEEMLDEAARRYINHPRGVSHDNRRLVLSSIFDWYSKDFGSRDELFVHLLRFAETPTAEILENHSGRITYKYDWSLNSP